MKLKALLPMLNKIDTFMEVVSSNPFLFLYQGFTGFLLKHFQCVNLAVSQDGTYKKNSIYRYTYMVQHYKTN